jgi:hypothetical protein
LFVRLKEARRSNLDETRRDSCLSVDEDEDEDEDEGAHVLLEIRADPSLSPPQNWALRVY